MIEKETKDTLRRKNKKLLEMIKTEREKNAGYEQLAKVHSAYIAFLLNKLGATEESGVSISNADIKEMLEKYEVRGYPSDGGMSIYSVKVN